MEQMNITRLEKDLLGSRLVSNENYYGIQTLRAIENFQLTHHQLSHFPMFIRAFAMVKWACAEANYQLQHLSQEKFESIQYACQKLIAGEYLSEFPIDMMQGGAGTSTNMNVNEVIANIALEYLGHEKGQYQYLHPNNDVNMSQSTNDVYPTAIRLALLFYVDDLIPHLQNLIISFQQKSLEFADILKMGRTQLQDAVPMTLGQEFAAFSHTLKKDLLHIQTLVPQTLHAMNLGGTAIGTGINTEADYAKFAIEHLSRISAKKLTLADDLIEATSDMGDFVLLSSLLKRSATKLSKISNDLRLLSSGPRTGINELQLEARQPGSSIMPGKVNPVIPEAMNISCFHIMSNDLAITLAAEAGQLQLNAMEPLIAFKLFESLNLLQNAVIMFKEKCIDTVQANAEHCTTQVYQSIGIITALNPYLGYETTTRLAKAAFEEHKNILDMIRAEQLLPEQQLQEILSPHQMLHPHQSAS